jgi:hypothetical protein
MIRGRNPFASIAVPPDREILTEVHRQAALSAARGLQSADWPNTNIRVFGFPNHVCPIVSIGIGGRVFQKKIWTFNESKAF